MLKLLITFAVVVAVVADLDSRWTVFKARHNKRYSSREDSIRKSIWIENLKRIDEHNEMYNQGKSTFYLGENQFTDMTNAEVVSKMNGLRSNRTGEPVKHYKQKNNLPKTVNWRQKGYVTQVKNQGHCRSCWTFSVTGAIEGQHFKSTGKLVSLSESNLLDCTRKFGNLGCDGGFMDNAFKYVIANHGVDTEASYPYVAYERKCNYSVNNRGATISSFKDVTYGSEAALQEAVAEIGPVSVGIDAHLLSFLAYNGGVYSDKDCSSKNINHAVLVVGYGTEAGKDYWLVKNSWGTTWGLDGYIKMSRNNNNNCGIASLASYPLV